MLLFLFSFCSQHLEGCSDLLEEWSREHPVTLDEQGKPLQTAAKENKEEQEQQQPAPKIEGEQVVTAPTAAVAANDLAPPAEEKAGEGGKPSQGKVGRIRAP